MEKYYSSKDLPKEIDEEPGKYPYTRGIHSEMYSKRLWTMRQYAGLGTAEESNKRYHYLLKQGVTGLSVAFDLPTQMGYDSDHEMAQGEVGKVGVSIASIEDMQLLLDKIPLKEVSISMTINSTASILLAFLLVLAEEKKVDWKDLRGTVQNDILKEYLARGTFIFPPSPSLRLVTDIIEFCSKSVPAFNTISISGYHIREAGSTAIDELAFTFANAEAYVQQALARGLDIDDFAPRLSFFFNCHNNFFEEVAKFRAARAIWAKLIREKYKAKKEKSEKLRFHTQTAGSTLTDQQPLNNAVRCSYQGLAAVLGGTQSLHVNAYDEARGLPTEESARLSLRTQQIIAHETGVTDITDPLAGSYYIENLTDQIKEAVFERLEKIDFMGGMLKALEDEYPQKEIEQSAFQYQKQIEDKEKIIVGVNDFVAEKRTNIPLQEISKEQVEKQLKRLAEFRAARDSKATTQALEALKNSAKGDSNLLPDIIDAIRKKATLGEISETLKSVWGTY